MDSGVRIGELTEKAERNVSVHGRTLDLGTGDKAAKQPSPCHSGSVLQPLLKKRFSTGLAVPSDYQFNATELGRYFLCPVSNKPGQRGIQIHQLR